MSKTKPLTGVVKPPKPVIKRRPVELSTHRQEKLKALAKDARRVNRHTQPGTREHRASSLLTRWFVYLHEYRLVPTNQLAKAAGMSSAGVSKRIRNHNDGTTA